MISTASNYLRTMTQEDIIHILSSRYGLTDPTISRLDGYNSLNYKVTSSDSSYVLKIYSFTESILADVSAENQVLSQLRSVPIELPQPMRSTEDELLYIDSVKKVIFRLITFVNGTLWAETNHSTKDIVELGEKIGELDNKLAKLTAPVINSRRTPWDLANFLDNLPHLPQKRSHPQ